MTPTNTASAEVNAFISSFAANEPAQAPEPASAVPTQTAEQSGAIPEQQPAGDTSGQQQQQQVAPAIEAAPAAPPPIDYEAQARQLGLDANNPQHRGVIEQLAASQQAAQAASQAPAPINLDLDKLNAAMMEGIAPAQPPAQAPNPAAPTAPAAAPAVPGVPASPGAAAQPGQPQGNPDPFQDGFTWKNPVEAMADFDRAFEARDHEQLAKVQYAFVQRQLIERMAPVLEHFNKRFEAYEAQLNEVLPTYRQSIQERREASNREAVIAGFKAQLPDFDDLSKLPEDGATVEIDGAKVPATPVNRICAANPWILKIQESDPNPDLAQRKTLASQYRAAYQLWKSSTLPKLTPAAVDTAFKAGQQAAAVNQQDRARQTMNAPGNRPPVAQPKSYVSEIQGATGEAASIFR